MKPEFMGHFEKDPVLLVWSGIWGLVCAYCFCAALVDCAKTLYRERMEIRRLNKRLRDSANTKPPQ